MFFRRCRDHPLIEDSTVDENSLESVVAALCDDDVEDIFGGCEVDAVVVEMGGHCFGEDYGGVCWE